MTRWRGQGVTCFGEPNSVNFTMIIVFLGEAQEAPWPHVDIAKDLKVRDGCRLSNRPAAQSRLACVATELDTAMTTISSL